MKMGRKKNEKRAVFYGICQADKFHENGQGLQTYFCDVNLQDMGVSYAFYSYDGRTETTAPEPCPHRYGRSWDRNDIITMTLDMTGGKVRLGYKKNNDDYGSAFENIDINKGYCMAVCIYFNDNLRLISESYP